jgi:hypothetical protein
MLRHLVTALLLCISGGAMADAATSYARGLEAARAGDWEAVERHMLEALRHQPDPSARARFSGLRGEPYVPHHYLGLAAFHRGDCRSARLQWAHADVAAIVERQAALKAEMTAALAECTRRFEALRPHPPQAEPQVASVPAVEPAAPRPAPSKANTPRPQATASEAGAQPRAAVRAGDGPDPALRAALQAYLDGRYAEVLELDAGRLPDARSRAHGFLLRAAARYTLAELGDDGAGDEPALAAEVRAALREDATLKVDERYFSPRFGRRFAELGRGG